MALCAPFAMEVLRNQRSYSGQRGYSLSVLWLEQFNNKDFLASAANVGAFLHALDVLAVDHLLAEGEAVSQRLYCVHRQYSSCRNTEKLFKFV